MRTRDFKTFSPEDEEVSRLQDNVTDALVPLIKAVLTDQVLLSNIEVATTPTPVAHKLGRSLVGWMVAGINAPETVYEISRTKTTLTLQATGPVTISMVVF